MSVKMTGAEYKRYMASDDPAFWPKDSFIDDTEVTVNGDVYDGDDSSIPDAADVVIVEGSYFKNYDSDGISLEAHFKRWRKAQSTVALVFDVPKDKEEVVREAVKAALKEQP